MLSAQLTTTRRGCVQEVVSGRINSGAGCRRTQTPALKHRLERIFDLFKWTADPRGRSASPKRSTQANI
jgi:hypothetical protein